MPGALEHILSCVCAVYPSIPSDAVQCAHALIFCNCEYEHAASTCDLLYIKTQGVCSELYLSNFKEGPRLLSLGGISVVIHKQQWRNKNSSSELCFVLFSVYYTNTGFCFFL
jgi:hypothetical protein